MIWQPCVAKLTNLTPENNFCRQYLVPRPLKPSSCGQILGSVWINWANICIFSIFYNWQTSFRNSHLRKRVLVLVTIFLLKTINNSPLQTNLPCKRLANEKSHFQPTLLLLFSTQQIHQKIPLELH